MSTVLERLETCMQALSATQRWASTEPMTNNSAKVACGDYDFYDHELYDFEQGEGQAPFRALADAHRARSSAIVVA